MAGLKLPIPGLIGYVDGESGRRRGGWGGGCWVVQTYDSNQLLALARNKNKKEKRGTKEKKNTYPSKSPSFNVKNVFPVICFSLKNALCSDTTPSPSSAKWRRGRWIGR